MAQCRELQLLPEALQGVFAGEDSCDSWVVFVGAAKHETYEAAYRLGIHMFGAILEFEVHVALAERVLCERVLVVELQERVGKRRSLPHRLRHSAHVHA